MFDKKKLFRSKEYRQFVSQHPCSICGAMDDTIVAHHYGPHGIGQKASDLQTIPVCGFCHGGIHDGKHGTKTEELAAMSLVFINNWLTRA